MSELFGVASITLHLKRNVTLYVVPVGRGRRLLLVLIFAAVIMSAELRLGILTQFECWIILYPDTLIILGTLPDSLWTVQSFCQRRVY